MSTDDLALDPNALDVTEPESHYIVQCSEVRLLQSILKPVDFAKEKNELSRFIFKIEASVEGDTVFSCLDVQVIAINPAVDENQPAYELRFLLLGVFTGEEKTPPEALMEFARMYTLAILWPYAREYTSDQLRRTGQSFDVLPIINPQVVTEKLIEGGLINIMINTPNTQTSELDKMPPTIDNTIL